MYKALFRKKNRKKTRNCYLLLDCVRRAQFIDREAIFSTFLNSPSTYVRAWVNCHIEAQCASLPGFVSYNFI